MYGYLAILNIPPTIFSTSPILRYNYVPGPVPFKGSDKSHSFTSVHSMGTRNGHTPDYDLPALVEAQKAYFRRGNTRSVDARLESLRRLEDAMAVRVDDFLDALASDLGKPAVEAYSSEVYFTLAEIRLYLKKLRAWTRPRQVRTPVFQWPARSEVRHEPFGAALVVSPWNYPLQLSLAPVVSAVGAGNTVVLKPSELSPATSALLAEVLGAVFDPRQVTVVEGGAELGRQLLEQSFDFWFFTGGERVGRLYAGAAAKQLAPAVLELGGKCPCVVDRDADLETSVKRILLGKFFNAGQTCVAPDFVAVPAEMHDDFVRIAGETLREWYGEEPGPDLARIVSEAHFDRLSGLLGDDAIRIGRDDRDQRYLAPTLVPHATWDAPSMREEIFGPVLPVVPWRKFDDLLGHLAELPPPLALYVFSRNRGTLEDLVAAVPSGSVCHNDAIKQAANFDLPFGGIGTSGMGRYRGRAGLETFSAQRSVVRRPFCCAPFEVRPPYRDTIRLLRKILR